MTDPVRFFPPAAESRIATAALAEHFPGAQAASQIVVVCESIEPDRSIWTAREEIAALAAQLRQQLRSSAVSGVLAPTDDPVLEGRLVSRDGRAALVVLRLAAGFASEQASALVADVERIVSEQASQRAAFRIEITGDATLGRDYLRAIEEGARRSALATVAFVALTLLLVYRAPLAAGVSLATLASAIAVASGAVVLAAQLGLSVAFQSRGFLVALVWGVGTDYCLLLFARTREEAARQPRAPAEYVAQARRESAPVVVTSALAVVLACALMGFARFGLFAFSGPALAIAVAVTLAAVLTLLPALMTLCGSALFWPRAAAQRQHLERLWPAIARLILRRPLLILIGSFAAVAPLAWLGLSVVPSFELELDFPKGSVSEHGFAALVRHFDPAQVSPLTVVLELPTGDPGLRTSDALDGLYQLTELFAGQPGIAKVWSATRPTGEPGLLTRATLRSQLAALAQGLGQATDGAGRLAAGLAQARQELERGRANLSPKKAELEAEQKRSLLGAFAPERFEAARRDLDDLDSQLGRLDAGLGDALGGALALEAGVAKGRARLDALDRAPGSSRLLDRLALTSEDLADSRELERALSHYLSRDSRAARFELQLTAAPNAPASVATAARLESALATLLPALGFHNARFYLAGPTAITRDLAGYTREDMARLDHWIVAGVFALLVALLRGLSAPLAITALILLSYFASLGALQLLVHAGFWPGLDWKAPFFLFVLLVAIGADYGVFLLGRVREEQRRQPFEAALARALEATGPVVTSCGLVLAGTFATLVLSRIAFLEQVGIGITIGVLLDTCLVRPFLLPAAALLLERRRSV
ncbi:MAG TPA: MMPL family transporter [Myxococcota bacterium]|nr:MMPL family transporter [Myxococcota bacterium]